MKKMIMVAAVFMSMCSVFGQTNELYILEVLTNGSTRILGRDNIMREVVILPPEHYEFLTSRLEAVWISLNATEDGRRRLHGRKVKQVVDESARIIRHEYADGYVHTASIPKKPERFVKRKTSILLPPIKKKPENISARQWEARQKRENRKIKEVTVEFAPGGIPVKEVK